MRSAALSLVLALGAPWALAQHGGHHSHGQASPYAGQQSREVKAISEQEMKDLLAGAGMGMAKAAELNRYPGPMHALELGDALGLTNEQRTKLASLMHSHKARARELGRHVVDLERALDGLFARGKPTPVEVEHLTVAIGQAQGRLRAEHLKTHLETTALLTPEQVDRYVKARGY
ncbi:MAG TPA: periplasmic heavy metal sensor [Usitatibacter sp.]|jgi:Spy/CpxP family protein refolding chaperone|nr:periplasmic heavy metal sensor [Usitatibacter sp.]